MAQKVNVLTLTNKKTAALFVILFVWARHQSKATAQTPEAGTWVPLEPGFRVFYTGYPAKLVIERDGKIIKNIW